MEGGAGSLRVEDLHKEYRGRASVVAADGISLEVPAGGLVGLLGVNGAGKTTTLKCAAALVSPTSGRVLVGDDDITDRPKRAATSMSILLEGNRNIYWRLTVTENLEYLAGLHGRSRRDAAADIAALVERLGLADKRRVEARRLSRGMQQKLALAASIVRRTPFLLLDEPTLGLDAVVARELRELLREEARERGVGVLLSSHDMGAVEDLCERVVVLAKGRVVAEGSVADLLSLFRVQAYTVLVDRVSAGGQAALTARFPLLTLDEADAGTEVRAELVDSAAVYDLFDLLRADGAAVRSVQQQEPDLESVFLHLIGGQA